MKDIWQWILKGGGAVVVGTILIYAGRYAIAQEVQPVKEQAQQMKSAYDELVWEQRRQRAEDLQEDCADAGYPESYCKELDRWFWNVKVKYENCIAGIAYDEREAHCGPEPQKPSPPEGD